jgi:membrane associated rhomboid family serine protease
MAASLTKDALYTMRTPVGRDQHINGTLPQSGAPMFLWVLVGIMVVIEIGLSLSVSGIFGTGDLRRPAYLLGAFWQPVLLGGATPVYPSQAIFMFVTYSFLHGGFTHLIMNSVILLSLGKFVAVHIGTLKTLLVLFTSTIVGAAFFGLVSANNGPMIGASGAVFGLIGIWQSMRYKALQRCGASIAPIFMEVLGLVIVNVLIFLLLSGGLAWEAHLGGWTSGWLFGHIFARHNCISEPEEHT